MKNALALRLRAEAVVARPREVVAARTFIPAASRSVPVAARLIAIGVPVLRIGGVLNDLRAYLIQHLTLDVRILLELFALSSPAVSHTRNEVQEAYHQALR